MCKIKKIFPAIFGIFTCSQISFAIDVMKLANICEAVENAIEDVSLEYEFEVIPPMAKEDIGGTKNLIAKGSQKDIMISKRPFTQNLLFTEKATFMNAQGDCHEETTILSYNGNVVKHFREYLFPSQNSEVRKSLDGTVSKDTRFLEAYPITLTPLGFTVLRFSYDAEKVPLSKRLKYQDGTLARIDESIQKVNDCNSICLELLQEYTKQVCVKIYFSIDHDYTPIRYDYMNGSNLAIRVDIDSLEKVENGIWFPSSGQIKGGDPEGIINRFHTTGEIKINQGIDDKIFDIVFPPGTKIVDEISGRQYTIKPTSEQLDQTLGEG